MAMASSNSSLGESLQIGWDVSAGSPRVSVACSWKCPSDLARVLCVVPAGEFDAEELSETAPNG